MSTSPKHVDTSISVKVSTIENEIRDLCQKVVDGWDRVPLESLAVKEFDGGITNRLFRCSNTTVTESSDVDAHVLVRIYGNKTELIIDRKKELINMDLLYKSGFGPKLYATFNNGIIYGYFHGKSLTTEDLTGGKYVESIALYLAKWHLQRVPGSSESSLWSTIEHWLSLVPDTFPTPEKDKKFKELDFAKIKNELKVLSDELSKLNCPVVFSHNDLLGGNIVVDDATGDIHFIDYEYAANNYRPFDIANHFCEWSGFQLDFSKYPKKEEQMRFYRVYLKTFNGTEPTDDELHQLYVEVNKFTLASNFFWASWALLQGCFSDIDFDFVQYAVTRFNRYFDTKEQLFALK